MNPELVKLYRFLVVAEVVSDGLMIAFLTILAHYRHVGWFTLFLVLWLLPAFTPDKYSFGVNATKHRIQKRLGIGATE